MTEDKKIYFFIGTTAELIKLAPVLRELKKRNIDYKIITSGQNKVNFEDFEYIIGKQSAYYSFKLRPIKLPLSKVFHFILWSIRSFFVYLFKFSEIFKEVNRKDVVFIVHGDTVSAALGAIVGKIYNLKVVHIEAGLRSFNFFEPFPEEFCRSVISYLAEIHFCPNKWSLNNIKNRSGVKVDTGQNTAYESCLASLNIKIKPKYLNKISKNKFFLLVLHRQEHMLYKRGLTKEYIKAMLDFADKSKIKCVFVLHNLTEIFLKQEGLYKQIKNNPNVITIPRLPHSEFVKIIEKSEFMATDGGSNQEEAYYLGKPCILLRKYTEQIEGLDSCVVLAKDDMSEVQNFLANYKQKKNKVVIARPRPSEIIADYLINS